jgi:hypothetical protein
MKGTEIASYSSLKRIPFIEVRQLSRRSTNKTRNCESAVNTKKNSPEITAKIQL